MRGLLIHSAPTDTPVLLRRLGWALLDARGGLADVPDHHGLGVTRLVQRHRDNPHVGTI